MELTGKEAPRRRSASSVSASEPVRRKPHPKSCPTKSPDRCRRASKATASGSADRRSTPGRSSPPSRRLRSRSEEQTSELQSLMRISYAFFCLKKNIRRYIPTVLAQEVRSKETVHRRTISTTRNYDREK